MDTVFQLLHYAASFFIILSVIVFIHEFGHYIIAKWAGVKVDVFSIGFGKEIIGRTDASGTRWKLSALPLGGYVKMFGDSSEASTPDNSKLEHLSPEEKAKTFHFKPLWKKALIVAGGPFANFMLTIAILTYFIFTVGLATTQPVVGEVMKDTPAQAAGLRSGDRVISVNGEEVRTFNDIPRMIATNLGTPVELVISRDDTLLNLRIIPKAMEDEDGLGNKIKRPLIGFKSLQMKYEDVGLPVAILEATKRTYNICETTLVAIGQMITGKRDTSEIKGPLGIAKLSGQAADKDWNTILWFMAMISANLGMVNLFPIPMLDGGHLLFYGVEAMRGKPMALKFQEWSFKFGAAILFSLMAFSLLNDVRQLF